MRVSTHTACIENLYMGNLSYRGYLGVTARNGDRNVKGVEVSIAKVMNMDPKFYTHLAEEDQMHLTGQD